MLETDRPDVVIIAIIAHKRHLSDHKSHSPLPDSSLYLLLSHHPVWLFEGWASATGVPLGHVRSLVAHLTLLPELQVQRKKNNF